MADPHTNHDQGAVTMSFGRSEFVDLVTPPGDRLTLYDHTASPTDQPKNDAADPVRAVPQSFIDAMIVREEVFVKEQHVALENELDEDDERSFHWVAYASIPSKANRNGDRRSSNSTKIPIGTIRLVPPPHPAHPGHEPSILHEISETKEAFVKLGRLAVIKEFRKAGVSKLLIESALQYAREHPYDVGPQFHPASVEASKKVLGTPFNGLVVIHAQTGVQKVWKRYGFERDEKAGNWDEEGIDHVLMWKRLDVTESKRRSKIWLPGAATMMTP